MAKLLHPKGDFGHGFHERPGKHAESRRLKIVIAVTAVFMVVEVAGGIMTNSLALLSDASHMLTHLFALVMALFSIAISNRPATYSKTFGYYRAEVLAALFNSITIIVIVFFIFLEGYRKLVEPSPVAAVEMLVIAFVGLLANIAGAYILRRSIRSDINIKGVFYHLLSDTISSVAIVIGGVVIFYTGFYAVDAALSVVIGIVVLVWGVRLFRDSVHILLESSPRGVRVEEVAEELGKTRKVRAVHDIHMWEITSGMYALTAHVVVGDITVRECGRLKELMNKKLKERYNIGHTNFQFEVE